MVSGHFASRVGGTHLTMGESRLSLDSSGCKVIQIHVFHTFINQENEVNTKLKAVKILAPGKALSFLSTSFFLSVGGIKLIFLWGLYQAVFIHEDQKQDLSM